MKVTRWILESESGQSVVDFKTKKKAIEYIKMWPSKRYSLFRETEDFNITKVEV